MASVLAMAVPGFLVLIAVELGVSLLKGRRVYRLNDSLSDLCCGLGDQSVAALLSGALVFPYSWLYEHARVFDLPTSGFGTFALAFVVADLAYYLLHVFLHRTNLGWAAHSVHHQSEDYNLAVALRQSWVQGLYSWFFYLPLAILGVPAITFAVAISLNLLYQFWIHTRLIGSLGPLEAVMNTPSHHRVHHGCEPQYIDRNYAGVFIIWDRLFRTFQVEVEEPTFGVIYPVRTMSAVRANFIPYADLVKQTMRTAGWWNRIQLWWRPPGWTPETGEPPHPQPGPGRGYDPAHSRAEKAWMVLQFLPTVPAVMVLMSPPPHPWSGEQTVRMAALAAFVLATLTTLGGFLDRRRWARPAEFVRIGLTALFLVTQI